MFARSRQALLVAGPRHLESRSRSRESAERVRTVSIIPAPRWGVLCEPSARFVSICRMAGMFLNSYGVTPEGSAALYEMGGALSNQTVEDLRRVTGTEVWKEGKDAYSYVKPGAQHASRVEREMSEDDGVTLFVIREALIQHALSLGLDAWARRARDLEIRGLEELLTDDLFEIERVLVLRVTSERYVDAPFILTARPRSRWRCVASLTDAEVAKHALGESAVRIAGEGPRRGRVESITGSVTTLLSDGEPTEVSSNDYTLAVNPALVSRWRGPAVLSSLRFTSGEITATHRRNQHAVADRFKFMGAAIRRLGAEVPVSGGGKITIGAPVQVRLESRS